jgi:phosphopantetheinyl transferase (holo-ACP synthase)
MPPRNVVPPSPTSILNLPIKRVTKALSIGNDICHVPRIVDILTYTSAKQKSERVRQDGAANNGVGNGKVEEQEQGMVQKRKERALRFVRRLLRLEERKEFEERVEDVIGDWVRVKEERVVVERVRERILRISGMQTLKKDESLASKTSGTTWKAILEMVDGKNENQKGKETEEKGSVRNDGESVEMGMLKVLEAVTNWKAKILAQQFRTTLDGYKDVLEKGERTEVGIERVIRDMESLVRRVRGGSASATDPANRGKEVMKEVEDVIEAENDSTGVDMEKVDPTMTKGGLKDDINAFLTLEERVHLRAKKVDDEILGCARFLAGRYVNLTFHNSILHNIIQPYT